MYGLGIFSIIVIGLGFLISVYDLVCKEENKVASFISMVTSFLITYYLFFSLGWGF